MDAVGQQVDARTAQVQGLLGDYISRLTGLGSQFLSFDPGGNNTGGNGGYGGGGGGGPRDDDDPYKDITGPLI